MSLRVVRHYLHRSGMPSTPRGSRTPQRAVAAHTTEGLAGEQGAWNTISWMHATAAQRNASYNEFWAVDEVKKELLVIEVVPETEAAHSIAPQPYGDGGPLYVPDAKVQAALGEYVHDPNMWVYAVSIAGKVADADRYARLPWFLADARMRLSQLRAKKIDARNLLEHYRFNPRTRTDWGKTLTAALEDTMEWVKNIRYLAPTLVTYRKEASYRRSPDLTPESSPVVLGVESPRRVIGTIEGVDFGAGSTWDVIVSSASGLRCVHPQDRLSAVVLAPPSGANEQELKDAKAAAAAFEKRLLAVKDFTAKA